MGPDPAPGWNKPRRGIGVPFRPGVPRPYERGRVIARRAWGAGQVDPAGWVSVREILRHYLMAPYPFSQGTLANLIDMDRILRGRLDSLWVGETEFCT
eukprot:12889236-Alexandrium_andersonii.AAC.1